MNNIFEIASRKKYRFPYKGWITTEDLWDLSLAELDGVFRTLNKDVKAGQEDSLMNKPDNTDTALLNRIRIVKYIFNVKEMELAAAEKAVENANKKQQIMAILAQRENDSLNSMSDDDLRKILKGLE